MWTAIRFGLLRLRQNAAGRPAVLGVLRLGKDISERKHECKGAMVRSVKIVYFLVRLEHFPMVSRPLGIC